MVSMAGRTLPWRKAMIATKRSRHLLSLREMTHLTSTPRLRLGALPLPACGERVGVRGPLRGAQNRGEAPSPAALRATTSPRARGEVMLLRRQSRNRARIAGQFEDVHPGIGA